MRAQETKYIHNNKIGEAFKEFFALIIAHPVICFSAYFVFFSGTFGFKIYDISALDILSGVTVTMLFHALLAIRVREADRTKNLAFWEYTCAIVMLMFGLAYAGAFSFIAFVGGQATYMPLTLLITVVVSLVGFTLVSSPKIMLAFITPIIVSVCVVVALQGSNQAFAYAGFLASYFVVMAMLVKRLSSHNAERLEARDKAKYLQSKIVLVEARMKGLVTTDKATGLYTRKFFDKSYAIEFRRAKRSSTPLSVIIAEIDSFIEYDECYGTEKAVKMHNALANILKSKTQRAGELVALFNNRSFALLLPNIAADDAEKFGRVIQKAVLNANIPHKASKQANLSCVSVSIGIGELTKAGLVSRNGLIKQAEEALRSTHKLNATIDDQSLRSFDIGRAKI